MPKFPIEMSILNKRELDAANKFLFFLQAMQRLNSSGKEKVFHRLEMLHLLEGEESLRKLVERTTT